jgi:hypothetical protein
MRRGEKKEERGERSKSGIVMLNESAANLDLERSNIRAVVKNL